MGARVLLLQPQAATIMRGTVVRGSYTSSLIMINIFFFLPSSIISIAALTCILNNNEELCAGHMT